MRKELRCDDENRYGLELTNNSKTSWAFSMPRDKTCVMATEICKKVCYGNGIRYQSKVQKAKRERNFRTVQLLLDRGGPELLAQNLVALIDQVRPIDWLCASILGEKTKTPWTIRIHDLGDFGEERYVKAWLLAAKERPFCKLWFYTRSFLEPELFNALTELAALPNCQGWLSVDAENYEAGLLAYAQAPGVWKLALLQQERTQMEEILPDLVEVAKTKELVSFPVHHGGRHVEPVVAANLYTCPAVLGVYKLESSAAKLRPCQACSFCLP
ncbi:MAG TPA: hypothetical protein PLC15_06560 [Candidatus Obscuribacter sp.]|nr:hypothetical protein [Candidatus Obscuribacter sp.]HND06754.1 hypothetical protein [Candidatus Obscuribacter sp.]HND67378.1 hypothetical protein [Candidatus Obscuribacter sp.]HNH73196.1 hypothetical protein [Candidatus Obscuribacter sp.]